MNTLKTSFITTLIFLFSITIALGFDIDNKNTAQKPIEKKTSSQLKVQITINPEKQAKKIKTRQIEQKTQKSNHRNIRLLKKKRADRKNNSTKKVEEVILAILAVLLPPLAVFLFEGLSTNFWIDLILTLFFWLPGILFAFYVIFLS